LMVEIEQMYFDERGYLRVLARVKSESKPGVWYGVYLWMRDGRIVVAHCTCPGFVFRRQCKHVEWVRGEVLRRAGRIGSLQL
jgi:uncharacterized Zn finger protein